MRGRLIVAAQAAERWAADDFIIGARRLLKMGFLCSVGKDSQKSFIDINFLLNLETSNAHIFNSTSNDTRYTGSGSRLFL